MWTTVSEGTPVKRLWITPHTSRSITRTFVKNGELNAVKLVPIKVSIFMDGTASATIKNMELPSKVLLKDATFFTEYRPNHHANMSM